MPKIAVCLKDAEMLDVHRNTDEVEKVLDRNTIRQRRRHQFDVIFSNIYNLYFILIIIKYGEVYALKDSVALCVWPQTDVN